MKLESLQRCMHRLSNRRAWPACGRAQTSYKVSGCPGFTHIYQPEKRRREGELFNSNMYTRSDSVTLSVNCPEKFAYLRAMATRSTQPEIFTFERIPTQATAVRSYGPLRSKKRCTRVMYPAKVRMHLPPAERSAAKRWLLALCLVVLWQVYTEEPCKDASLASSSPATNLQTLQVFPVQSAGEQGRTEVDDFSSHQLPPWFRILSNSSSSSAVQTESARAYDQSTRNGYMVALLVYHKLGSEN